MGEGTRRLEPPGTRVRIPLSHFPVHSALPATSRPLPVAFMSAWHATALIITRLPQPQYKLHARLLSSSIFSAE